MTFLSRVARPSSRARDLYALKNFFQYHKLPEPVQRLKAPSQVRTLEWWLSPADIVRLIEACHFLRDRAALGLGYDCALRNGELSGLDRADIDRGLMQLRVRSEKKRGRIRMSTVPLHRNVLALVDDYLGTRKDSEPALFLNCTGQRLGANGVNDLVKKALLRAGIDRRRGSRNVLRHARASHLRLQGLPLEDIRQLLRHERLETSLIYAHIGVSDLARRIPEPELHLVEVTKAA